MSENFIRPTDEATRKIVESATSKGEDIGASYERMKDELRAAMGMISPQAAAEHAEDERVSSLPVPVAPPAPVAQPTCYRVLYLRGNDRLEIYGVSEAELDAKETQLQALYQ